MFAPELKSGAVRPVLTEWALPPMTLLAIFPAGRLIGAKARASVAFIEKRLASPPALAEDSVPRFARRAVQSRRTPVRA